MRRMFRRAAPAALLFGSVVFQSTPPVAAGGPACAGGACQPAAPQNVQSRPVGGYTDVMFGCPYGGCQPTAGQGLVYPGCAYYCSNTMGSYYIEGPTNWSWMFPEGGVTPYPGLPGSGMRGHSDYSYFNWYVPPSVNAADVALRLKQMGIPRVPPEPEFLGKNPCLPDKLRMPIPNSWLKDPPSKDGDKEKEKEKDGKPAKPTDPELDKDKGKDQETGLKEIGR